MNIEENFRKLKKLIEKKDYISAKSICDLLIPFEDELNDPEEFLRKKARISARFKDFKQALSDIEKLVQKYDPREGDYYFLTAYSIRDYDYEKALFYVKKAEQMVEKDDYFYTTIMFLAGYCLLKNNKIEEAKKYVDKIHESERIYLEELRSYGKENFISDLSRFS